MQTEPSQLHMKRSLTHLPALVVPTGYHLRRLEPDDTAAWAGLLASNGELGAWTEEQAAPLFAVGSPMPLAGAFFVLAGAEPVATAQLHRPSHAPYVPLPELGWVAVVPAHQGHGLAFVVSLAVLHYAASVGHRALFLRTDAWRLPALWTYLKLGFEPWIMDDTQPERWQAVYDALQRRHPGQPCPPGSRPSG